MLTYKLWSRTKHNIYWNLDVFLIFPLFEKSSSYFHIHECSVACRTLQLLMRVELWSRIRIWSKKWILVEIWGDLSVGVMTWHLRLGNNHRDLNFHFFVIKPKDGKRKTKIIIEQTRQHIVCYFYFFFENAPKLLLKTLKLWVVYKEIQDTSDDCARMIMLLADRLCDSPCLRFSSNSRSNCYLKWMIIHVNVNYSILKCLGSIWRLTSAKSLRHLS